MRKAPKDSDALLTVPVAAVKMGVKPIQLHRWIEYGLVTAVVDGSTLKISQFEVMLWKEKIQKGDLPNMEHLPQPFRLQPYKPKQIALSNKQIKMTTRKSLDASFDEYFKEKNNKV